MSKSVLTSSFAKQFAASIVWISLLVLGNSSRINAQLVVNEFASNAAMISQLEGTGINIINSSFTINGVAHDRQVGLFSNTPSGELSISNGMIISTGYGSGAVGPNNSTSFSVNVPGNGTTIDPDLALIEPAATEDMVIIEFDFIPRLDTLQIEFAFASEEYCEYTCSPFNDAFAFFVSGPGIAGPYSLGAENFAQLPDGTGVAINNVHNGNCLGWYAPCNPINAAYYYNNAAGIFLQADGLTVGLQAKGAVQSCQTYHAKIVIADAGDSSWDSMVFLKDFSSLGQDVTVTADPAFNTAIEECSIGLYLLERAGDIDQPLTVDLTYSGTAINGVDYSLLPSSVYFAPYDTLEFLIINPLTDGITEGLESVTITTTWYICSEPFSAAYTFDLQEPSANINCPANFTVVANPITCIGLVTIPFPSATSNCASTSLSRIDAVPYSSNSQWPIGSYTITYRAVAGTSGDFFDDCSFQINVVDNVSPVISSCPPNISTNIIGGLCGANVIVGALVASDNCSAVTITNSFNGTSNASGFYPVGFTNVLWTVTDASGNTTTCTTVVTVVDTQIPVITSCPPNQSVFTTSGACTRAVTIPQPTVTDNCPLTYSNSFNGTSNASGTYPIGTTTVTWTVTDPSGNIVTCAHTITVTDNVVPTITCPANQTVSAGINCTIAVVVPIPATSDNCGVASVTNSFNGTSNASGNYSLGTTTVIWTVTDNSGNVATCSHTITITTTAINTAWASAVNDPNSCVLATEQAFWQTLNNLSAAGDDLSKPNNTGMNNTNAFSLNDVSRNGWVTTTVAETNRERYFGISAVDAGNGSGGIDYSIRLRDDATLRIVENGTNVNNPGSYSTGDVLRIFIDNNAVRYYRNATLLFTSTVAPAVAPYFVDCAMNQQNSTLNNIYITNPTCGVFQGGSQTLPVALSYQWFRNGNPVGTNSSTYTNTTLSDNDQITVTVSGSNGCSATSPAVVVDIPVMSCSGSNINATTSGGACSTLVTVPNPTVTGSCSGFSVTNNFNGTTNASGTYPLGITTVVFTISTSCGTFGTCSINVTVTDDDAPSITCPSTQTLNLNSSCQATLPNYTTLSSVSDNCTSSGSITVTQSPAAGTVVSGTGTTTITLTATDTAGNSSNCTFNVTKVDNIAPTITCPANITVNTNGNSCTANVNNASLGTPVTSDNCGVASVSNNHPSASYSVGTTNVTWTVTDNGGNTSTCIQTVTVIDNNLPSITCPGAQTLVLNSSCTGTLGNYTSLATASDPCGAVTVTQSPAAGTPVSGVGTTVVTLTVTDSSGNISTCTFNVNRIDNIVPTITCPLNITVNVGTGTCVAIVASLGTPI
ncbi:MAG: choice-of-anchor L domain-containing protein, partial [Flavobacteriales bacterium]|nr:choice-of-anchor L domain-containing protein [Flavobacteriales bacterium]